MKMSASSSATACLVFASSFADCASVSHWKCSVSSPASPERAMQRFLGLWNWSQSRAFTKAATWRWRFRMLIGSPRLFCLQRGPALEFLLQQLFDLRRARLVGFQGGGWLLVVLGVVHLGVQRLLLDFERLDFLGQ